MALNTKKDASFDYQGPEPGAHEARIVAVIYLGTHERTFEGVSKGMAKYIYIVYEITDEKDDKGFNKIMAKEYPLFSGDRANLSKVCLAALGAEPPDGWDLDKLPNQPVMLTVAMSKKGYANVGEVTALRPQQKAKVGKLDNVPFYWDNTSGTPYVDCDWVPWIYSHAASKRLKVSEYIAAGLDNEVDTASPRQQAATAGAV